MIMVYFADGTSGSIGRSELETMIKSKRILAFRRYGEWVRLDYDSIRGKGGHYDGPERREDYIKFQPLHNDTVSYWLLQTAGKRSILTRYIHAPDQSFSINKVVMTGKRGTCRQSVPHVTEIWQELWVDCQSVRYMRFICGLFPVIGASSEKPCNNSCICCIIVFGIHPRLLSFFADKRESPFHFVAPLYPSHHVRSIINPLKPL